MDRDRLVNQLLSDEGVRLQPYKDSLGYLTIGVGRLIDPAHGGGISQDEAMYLLANDVRNTYSNLTKSIPWMVKLNDCRQNVLLNMAFNLGVAGLLGFKQFLSHLQAGEYNQAATAGLQSRWATQVPARANRLMNQIRSGDF